MANAMLTESIRQVHKDSDATYGMPRIRAELQDHGQHVSRKRVAHLMRKACIRGVSRRRAFTVTTERDRRQRPAPDLGNRPFRAPGPDQLWVADMSYLPTSRSGRVPCTWPWSSMRSAARWWAGPWASV
jgi:putative transposase